MIQNVPRQSSSEVLTAEQVHESPTADLSGIPRHRVGKIQMVQHGAAITT